ncbi:MAG: bifunctional pyr operon transcriptional regulator/uracil phosphoribosyltransferase PyrR [Bacteroidota bacterium]
MEKKLVLGDELLEITLNRLCQELIENHQDFEESVVLGLQPRGIYVADHIQARLEQVLNKSVPFGHLDVTFYRDDFRRRENPIKANATNISFIIENKKVILVDDVLYTGRTVRAALDAMIAFGRPKKVELLVLVNRLYSRDLPIEPNYVGRDVSTLRSQRIQVEWKSQGFHADKVWLIEQAL